MTRMSSFTRKRISQLKEELLALRRPEGGWEPRDVVEFARYHRESALHRQFEWNIQDAAYEHWLHTARRLIVMHITVTRPEQPTVQIPLLSVISQRGEGSYRPRDEIGANEVLRLEQLAEISSRLRTMAARFAPILPELDPVWDAIASAAIEQQSMPAGAIEEQPEDHPTA